MNWGGFAAIDDGHIIEKAVRAPEVPLGKFGKESLQEDIAVQFDNHESRGRAVRRATTSIPSIAPARLGNGTHHRQRLTLQPPP